MQGSKVFKMALSVFVALCAFEVAQACMCMQEHPQLALCRENTYAALVKVRHSEYVYKAEKAKYKPTKSNGILKYDELDKDLDYGLTDLKKNSDEKKNPKEIAGHVEVVVKDLHHLTQKELMASDIRYRVKVYETYKGLKPEEVQGKKVYIYTAPDESLCGKNLDAKEMYLVIGHLHKGRLNIGLCDVAIPWSSLDMKQKRAVRRNMRAAKTTCASSCQVDTCTWSGCLKPDKDACTWSSRMERTNSKLNIHPATLACVREPGKQDARCVWANAFGNGKRGRRRRRHHADRSESKAKQSLPISP